MEVLCAGAAATGAAGTAAAFAAGESSFPLGPVATEDSPDADADDDPTPPPVAVAAAAAAVAVAVAVAGGKNPPPIAGSGNAALEAGTSGGRRGGGTGGPTNGSGPNSSSLKLGWRTRDPEQPLKPQPATSLSQWGQWSAVPVPMCITSEPAALLRLPRPPLEFELLPSDDALSLDAPRLRIMLDHPADPRCAPAPNEVFHADPPPPSPGPKPWPFMPIVIGSNAPLSLLERTEIESSPPTLPQLDVPRLLLEEEERLLVGFCERERLLMLSPPLLLARLARLLPLATLRVGLARAPPLPVLPRCCLSSPIPSADNGAADEIRSTHPPAPTPPISRV